MARSSSARRSASRCSSATTFSDAAASEASRFSKSSLSFASRFSNSAVSFGLALLHVGLRALDGELALGDLRHPLGLALLEPGREVGLALLELRGELGLALLELRLGALERELALGGRRRALGHLLQRAGARLVGGLQRLGLELDLLLSLVGACLRLLEGRVRGRDLLAHRLGLRQLLGGRPLTGSDGGLGRGELGDALVQLLGAAGRLLLDLELALVRGVLRVERVAQRALAVERGLELGAELVGARVGGWGLGEGDCLGDGPGLFLLLGRRLVAAALAVHMGAKPAAESLFSRRSHRH